MIGEARNLLDAMELVRELQSSFERMSGSYRARFAEMLAQGETLAAGGAEVLGQLQYQDVVRQCVERLRQAVAQRNETLVDGLATRPAELADLIGDVVESYLAQEALHGGPLENGGDALAGQGAPSCASSADRVIGCAPTRQLWRTDYHRYLFNNDRRG